MIIYLNGTSSSGKTSIAQELQKLLQEPYFYFSIDTLLHSLSQEDLEAIMGKRPHSKKLNWESIFEGYFASVAALSYTGNNVIADCPVYSEKLGLYFQKHLGPIDTKLIVKVNCPLDVLESREKARGDRAIGIAKGQYDGIHRILNHDLVVDSSQTLPAIIASAISKLVR